MNGTRITEIILLGFENLQDFKYFVFFLFLVIYIVTITGNVLIILLVLTSYRLRSPMFFFLGHLSFSDMLLTSNIVPSMLHVILSEGGIVLLGGCITQFFLYGSSATTECLLLSAMSYDRYLAICKPLHYTAIMDLKLCFYLVIICWSLGFAITLIPVFLMQTLWFCGPNVIDHFFCDLGPLLELSCSDASVVKYEVFVFSSLLTVIPFVLITITYVYIFLTILRITSSTGRQKTFSTCSSHLAVVCTYYGALFVMYVVPSRGHSLNMNKVVSLMYTVVTPLFNPIIYSLRNQEIKLVMKKYISVCKKKR
ncbi:olfactory receptor 11A1-like [Aquarana catesbeiana]|uniref:olfactory receptor 11A1-like n=1 Tax=Aquarana catesbeiana TaxID=8400 RepID=UPI003CC98321